MSPSVTGTWSNLQYQWNTFDQAIPQANVPAQAAVASADGDWLIAVALWRTLPGDDVIAMICDDGHNLWVPAGPPSPVTPGGSIRCAAWLAANAQAARNVCVSPAGYATVCAVWVVAVEGLTGWPGIPVVAYGHVAAGTSVQVAHPGLADPGAQAVYAGAGMVADGTGVLAVSGGVPQAGSVLATGYWSSGYGPVGGGYNVSSTSGCAGTGAGPETVTFTGPSGTAAEYGACVVAIPVAGGPAPVPQPNPDWPAFQLQAGFGSGISTPPDAVTWTDITDRWLAGTSSTTSRGIQYELNQLQASTVSLALDNNDGAFDPANSTSSPFWPDVTVDTPIRLLATWQGRTYSLWRGFIDEWPQVWEEGTKYGVAQAEATDGWSLLGGQLGTLTQEVFLAYEPYAYFPLADPAASSQAPVPLANIAPGNTTAAMISLAKSGAGPATWSLGNSSPLWPDSGSSTWRRAQQSGTCWEQDGLTGTSGVGQGYSLMYSDRQMPALDGGLTVVAWFSPGSAQVNQDITLIRVEGQTAPIAEVAIVNQSASSNAGALKINRWNTSRALTSSIYSTGLSMAAEGGLVMVALMLTRTTWQASWYLAYDYEGQSTPGSYWYGTSGTGTFASQPASVQVAGNTGRFGPVSGQCFTGQVMHWAIYPRVLNMADTASLAASGLTAFREESIGTRTDRILGMAGYAGPRLTGVLNDDAMCAVQQLAGTQPGQLISDAVSSAGGLLCIDGTGALILTRRQDRWNRPARWVLGEDTASGEIPYDGSISVVQDKAQLINEAMVSLCGAQGQTLGPYVTVDNDSIGQHGEYVSQYTSYLDDGNLATDQANWMVQVKGSPSARIDQVSVNAAANPAATGFVLGVEVGDVVRVNRRPQGAPAISMLVQCTQVSKAIDRAGGVLQAQCTLSPFLEGNVLVADDPVHGQLTPDTRLPW